MKKITFALTALLALFALNFQAVAQPFDEKTKPNSLVLTQSININQANISQLSLLKGIGKKKAQAIVSYREENGKFSELNELLKVKGIGKKVLNDNLAILSI